MFLERFVETVRHVEVPIFGDGEGKVIALGECDFSLQWWNQKVVEETPEPRLSDRETGGWRSWSVGRTLVGCR